MNPWLNGSKTMLWFVGSACLSPGLYGKYQLTTPDIQPLSNSYSKISMTGKHFAQSEHSFTCAWSRGHSALRRLAQYAPDIHRFQKSHENVLKTSSDLFISIARDPAKWAVSALQNFVPRVTTCFLMMGNHSNIYHYGIWGDGHRGRVIMTAMLPQPLHCEISIECYDYVISFVMYQNIMSEYQFILSASILWS